MNKEISIIIINYKTPYLCCDCLKSIELFSFGFSYELIIVDNNSQDNSKSIITSRYPNVIYIQSPENLGTTKACNLAADYSNGEFLFFLNSDTLLLNNAIFLMKDYLISHNMVGIVGGNLFTSHLKPTHSFCKRYGIKQLKKETKLAYLIYLSVFKRKLSNNFNYTKNPLEVDYLCGADILVRKSIFQRVDGFEEKIFMYGEDFVLAKKVKRIGYTSVSLPTAKIVHLEGESSKNKKGEFSKEGFIRFLTGTCIAFQEVYGSNIKYEYIKLLFIKCGKLAKLFYLTGNKKKYYKYVNQKIILSELMKK